MRFLATMNGDGIDDNGGSPQTVKKNFCDINWAWPATASNPAYFEVVAFTGTDPTVTTAYLFAPVRVPGADRRLVVPISPRSNVSGVNAAVRPVYA